MKRFLACLTLLVVLVATPQPLAGQAAPSAKRVTLDVSVGGASGRGGGDYVNLGGGIALDAAAAWRGPRARTGTLVLGGGFGSQGGLGNDLDCAPDGSGGCRGDFPTFRYLVALAGWEVGAARGGRGASARVLAGPGHYVSDEGSAFGLQARIELASPAPFGVALVASARGSLLPRFHDEAVTLGAVGFGVRLQLPAGSRQRT